jgi:biopolymer transport protein ExbD
MQINEQEEVQGEINIVPMIDAIFSILAFFIISSLSLIRSEGLSVNLPSAETAEVKQTEQINITIKSDGDVFLNKKPLTVEKLKGELQKLIPDNQESLVIINGDEQVNHGLIVQVMDNVRQVKGAKLAIATKKK